MRRFKISILMTLILLVSTQVLAQKPKIRILATGGTIAGVSASATSSAYGAGQVGIQTLIDAVPQIKDVANVSGEQIVNIGSQDMNDAVWLKLAKRINQLLNEEGYDGVLVTHGTDTMEETAYFLSLTVHSDKPVVLVGSMRPSTAISADGPANLYNGICAVADPSSKGQGKARSSIRVRCKELDFTSKGGYRLWLCQLLSTSNASIRKCQVRWYRFGRCGRRQLL